MSFSKIARKRYAICFGIILSLTCHALITRADTVKTTFPAASAINLTEYAGQVVYVDFWASWCVPCRYSFPWMNEMYRKYKTKGLVILAVSIDEKAASIEEFVRRYPAVFPIYHDPEAQMAQNYDLPGMPSSFIYDHTGKLVKKHHGFRKKDGAQLESLFKKLLAQRSH